MTSIFVRKSMSSLYIITIVNVLFCYVCMLIGHAPTILSRAADAVALMQEILEIGAYKPIVVTMPSIGAGLAIEYYHTKINGAETDNITFAILAKSSFHGGLISAISFVVFFVSLLIMLPFTSENPVDQFGGAPHSSVYVNCFSCIIFHGFLLLLVGIFTSAIFMNIYVLKQDILVSYFATILIYQVITYLESIIRIPSRYKIDCIASGWFRIGYDTPWLDMLWAIPVILMHMLPFVVRLIVKLKKKDKM